MRPKDAQAEWQRARNHLPVEERRVTNRKRVSEEFGLAEIKSVFAKRFITKPPDKNASMFMPGEVQGHQRAITRVFSGPPRRPKQSVIIISSRFSV
jgi:hypothetical protein